jgi:hypothetical protein
MRFRNLVVVGSLGLASFLNLYSAGRSQERAVDGANGAAQEGVEVLARGPVHEAFAEVAIRSPRPTPVVDKQPPDPIEEMPPNQKPEGANVIWMPGYWAWDDDRSDFIWVSGIWRDLPPDRQWVAGYWNQVEGGWQWVGGYWNVQAQQTVDYLPPPPDPIAESVSPAPDAQSIYAPGCWVWYQTRYMWRPGFWLGYRPGWIWTPAYYRWTPAGYVFIDGYWDYPFANRGLLFSSVFIDRAFWGRPSWYYRPYYAVSDSFLLGALFARLNYGSYYYGDYFDPRYSSLGFVPWVDFRYGRTIPDPLFSYYRWQYAASNPRWDSEMRQLYVTRRDDARARPSRTFAEASRAPAAGLAKPGTFASIQTATALTPLTRVASTGMKLQTVPQAQLTEIRQAAVQHHDFAKQRGQVEAKAFAQGQASAKSGQALKLELPKSSGPAAVTTPSAKAKAPPPRPEHPKPQERPAPRAEPQPGSRPPATRPEPKVEPKAAPKAEPKAAPKGEPKVEPKPAPKTEPKAEPKPAPRVEPKPAPAEPKPAPRVEPKPAPAPAPAPPRQPEPKPAPPKEKEKDKKDK